MDRQIPVITEFPPATTEGSRSGEDVGGGFGSNRERGGFRIVNLSAEGLRDQVANLLEVVDYVFDCTTRNSALALEQLELSVEISSEGQVSLLGTGGKAAGRGAIKLLFRKRQNAPPAP